ncbi:MAG: hypothetical protein WBB07_23365 [Mycobacterium sp.]
MNSTRSRRGPVTRDATGAGAAEAFVLIAVATILLTRGYLEMTGYPQIGGGELHIAHALWGGALMMIALLIGWMTLGFGARVTAVLLGGIGFGLFLDEVGKFVTKTNDYFYGPSAEIMYILVVLILVTARVVRDMRPLTDRECLASASAIATEGLARGLPDHRRAIGLRLADAALQGGAPAQNVEQVRALLVSADTASDRLYRFQRWLPTLVPGFFRSPRWVTVLGWLMVIGAVSSVLFAVLDLAFGSYLYVGDDADAGLEPTSAASIILLANACLTAGFALPAMIGRRRDRAAVWPLRWLRNAALVFTFLNALVDFATNGFGALANMAVGLFTLAVLTYQLDVAARAQAARSVSSVQTAAR